MTSEAAMDSQLAAAAGALQAGDWAAARDAFRAALEQEETAEALAGLGEALWWLGEIHESVDFRERAYAEFRRAGRPAEAAELAIGLSVHHAANIGNDAAAAGWLARAARLVEEHGLDDVRGWVMLLQADGLEPAEGERLARRVRALAADAGDFDLELCALAELGAALVRQGRLDEGLPVLDEAMAGSLAGEGSSFDTVVYTSCTMLGVCTRCAEFERAVSWIQAADRFTERYGCPFLYVYCRTMYASVLFATGDWERAESELSVAIRESGDSQAMVHGLALATLAELRLAEARLEEAERLVAGFDGQGPAAAVQAAIQLARGEHAAAAATAARGLEAAASNRLTGALLAELCGEAEIALGRAGEAAARGRALATDGQALGCRTFVARGERLQGHAAGAGDPEAARRHLDAALATFAAMGMPLEAARTRALLAAALRHQHPELAVAEARAALETFEALGAARDADAAAALLRELGVKAARAGPKGIGTLTKRESEVLALLGEGLSNPEIAERLYVSRKTAEHHVARILSKLGVRSRAEAAAEAVRSGALESAGK